VEIPASVKIIEERGFSGCTGLNAITFASDGQIREIHGFSKCESLNRIEIPTSFEYIG
jgi:hypothetical protein